MMNKRGFFSHARSYIFRGLLAIIPILLCIFAVGLLYVLIDKRVIGFLNRFFEVRRIPGLGILLVLVSLYLIGLAVSNIIGRRMLRLIEGVTQRIPFIKTIYEMGKQISRGLDGGKETFKRAVLVSLNPGGPWVPAFVVNSMKSRKTGEELLFILIPTAPTPASGFICVVRSSQVLDPGWTVEECLKTIISVGIIAPQEKGIEL